MNLFNRTAALLVGACTLFLFSCGGGNSFSIDSKSDSSIDSSRSIHDQQLLQNVDYNMDLSGLSYDDLRLLSNYPLAKQGFWFKEYDLNFRFRSVKWYNDLIAEKYFLPETVEGWTEFNQAGSDTAYWNKWSNDYDALKSAVSLSSADIAFIDRVKKQMSEIEKNKYYKVEGYDLYNPDMLVNYGCSFSTKNKEQIYSHLRKYGFAVEKSNYIQMFSVYEQNDYSLIPSFVTTDLFLQLFSLYQRNVLTSLENYTFSPAIQRMCQALYTESKLYSETTADSTIKQLSDFSTTYYAIALSLITGQKYDVPESMTEIYNNELNLIYAEKDEVSPFLRTAPYDFMYSQFKPRAQYSRNEESKRYFRTLMWLQQAWLCPCEKFGLQRGLFMALVLDNSSKNVKKDASSVFDALDYMVGEPNGVPILDLSRKLSSLGIRTLSDLTDASALQSAYNSIVDLYADKNLIVPKKQLTCQPKMRFVPQRFVPDADVLNNMYDSTPNANRAYPHVVDIFDAFGVKAAVALNDTFYTAENKSWKDYDYFRKLCRNRYSAVKTGDGSKADWNKTGYNKWMQVLIDMQKTDKSYPGFMNTSSWQLKNLNSAMASWTMLKHNNLLYAYQPNGAECGDGGPDELPEPDFVGFVEPNLIFWKTLKEAVLSIEKMALQAGYQDPDSIGDNRSPRTLLSQTETLVDLISFCESVSKKEIEGKTLSKKDIEGIRTIGANVEYLTLDLLVVDRKNSADWMGIPEVDKNIAATADIFTRNFEGCDKNGIQHAGVGNANLIYVICEHNGLFYLSRGAIYSFYEFVRPERLNDEQWQNELKSNSTPSLQKWFTPFFLNGEEKSIIDADYVFSSGC